MKECVPHNFWMWSVGWSVVWLVGVCSYTQVQKEERLVTLVLIDGRQTFFCFQLTNLHLSDLSPVHLE